MTATIKIKVALRPTQKPINRAKEGKRRVCQKWKLCENSSPKLGKVPAGQRGMAHQKQLYIKIIKKTSICHTTPSPLFQHQWAAPHQCQNKFCRWLRLAPLVYLRRGVSVAIHF